ncbi:hypothetical protein [Streptomyces sp. NBC_00316]|uniref:hypothetical protein n=1 Tax=Streptomyces sp. NBC_00316 TaxID=2975710 RepID=UPI002E28F54C|nr:hypothetical protein [Streptomyces sp. NBC_00316]
MNRATARPAGEWAQFLDIVGPGPVTAPEWFRGTIPPAPEESGVHVAVVRVP